MVRVGKIVKDVESEIDIHLVEWLALLTQLPDLFLLLCSIFGFREGLHARPLNLETSAFFQQAVNLLFKIFEIFFLTFFYLNFFRYPITIVCLLLFNHESSRSIGFHGSAQPMLSCDSDACTHSSSLSRRNSVLVRWRRWLLCHILKIIGIAQICNLILGTVDNIHFLN